MSANDQPRRRHEGVAEGGHGPHRDHEPFGEGAETFTIEDVLARVPGRVDPRWRILFAVLLALGVAAFAATLATDPQRAWASMLANVLFWLPMTQGAVLLVAVFIICKAKFSIPMQRMALGVGNYAPWMLGALAVTLLFGNRWLLPWVTHPVAAKAAYLNLPFLLVRDLGLVGALTWFHLIFRHRLRRLDAGLARGRVHESLRARYEKWSRGWKGDAVELAEAGRVLPRMAGAMIPAYAVVYTFIAWDLVMSLDPHWATTQLAPWFWVGGILTGLAAISVLMLVLRRAYGLERFVSIQRVHQQAKLLYGFTNFRTYLSWVLFLPIWYGNLPEEASWMVRRVHYPYAPWLLSAVFFGWLVPLLGFTNLAAKKRSGTHIFFACSMLLGVWIEQLVLVYPSVFRTTMPVGIPEVAMLLGFLGGFGLVYQQYAATRPLIALDKLDVLSEPFH